MRLSLSLLGPFRAVLDGEDITSCAPTKGWALLAYVAVESDRPHRREALAEMLWPDRSTGASLGNLRSALSQLRSAIRDCDASPALLLVDRNTIRINPAGDCLLDVTQFRRLVAEGSPDSLKEAVTLYGGSFLDGLAVTECDEFDRWRLLRRHQLEQQALAALNSLAAHCERLGELAEAQAYAWQQLRIEPAREEAHQQLMRALALSGQRSAALAQYETCRSLLASELDAAPSPETDALCARIREGRLPAPTSHAALPAQPSARADAVTAQAPAPRSLCLGREPQLARLVQSLDAAIDGRGRVAFVVGEPGAGKTVLARELGHRGMEARPDLVVTCGTCNAYTGAGDPYLPFLEALAMLGGGPPAGPRATLGGEQARRLLDLLPDFAQVVAADGADLIGTLISGAALLAQVREQVGGDPAWLADLEQVVRRREREQEQGSRLQAHLFRQYTDVLLSLSRRHPLLLVIDDLQWADTGSVALLFHLARKVEEGRVLLLGLYRPGDVALGRGGERHPLEPVVNELCAQLGDIVVDLDQADGAAFVNAVLDAQPNRLGPSFRRRLYHRTRGHALFTTEVLHDLRTRGGLEQDEGGRWVEGEILDWDRVPERLGAAIAERIGRLTREARTALTVAAVGGEEFAAEVVAAVTGEPEGAVVARMSGDLSRQQLVRALDLQRSGSRTLSRYRFRHFLFQRYLYDGLDEVERCRLHAAVGEALERLHGDNAAEVALQLAWHFEQARMGARAIEYGAMAADRAMSVFAPAEAASLLQQALRIQEDLLPEDGGRRCDLLLALGVALREAGQPRHVIDVIAPLALDRAHSLNDAQRAAAACRVALAAFTSWGAAQAWAGDEYGEWVARLRQHTPPDDLELLRVESTVARTRGDGAALIRLHRRAMRVLDGAERAGDVDRWYNAACLAIWTATLDGADTALRLARRVATGVRGEGPMALTRDRWTVRVANAALYAGAAFLSRGYRDDTEDIIAQAREMAEHLGSPFYRLWLAGWDVHSATYDGRLEEAVAICARIAAASSDTGIARVTVAFYVYDDFRALLLLGRPEEALAHVPAFSQPARAAALAHLGRRDAVDEMLRRLVLDRPGFATPEDGAAEDADALLLEAAVRVGHARAAEMLAGRLRNCGGHLNANAPACIGRHLGDAALLLGRPAEALGFYREALDVASRMRFRPEVALVRLQVAELLLEHYPDRRHEAVEHLGFAAGEFRAMKMAPALERALSRGASVGV